MSARGLQLCKPSTAVQDPSRGSCADEYSSTRPGRRWPEVAWFRAHASISQTDSQLPNPLGLCALLVTSYGSRNRNFQQPTINCVQCSKRLYPHSWPDCIECNHEWTSPRTASVPTGQPRPSPGGPHQGPDDGKCSMSTSARMTCWSP